MDVVRKLPGPAQDTGGAAADPRRCGVVAVWRWSNFGETPHVQGQRRSPSNMEGVARLHLESNPIPIRDAQSAQRNLVHTRTQRPHRD